MIGFAVGRWRPTSSRNRAISLSIVAMAILQLVDLLFQIRQLLGQVQNLDGLDGMIQDRHGSPDLLAWLVTRQVSLEGIHGLARGLLQISLANGSRIISLPGDEETIRGYSGVRLLVVDEASRVPDSLYYAVRPMLAVSQGRMICLSTPFGKRGSYHDEWFGSAEWSRVKVTADECPRIAREFLEEERLAIGERWYRQEYHCSFEDVIDAVFLYSDVMAAIDKNVAALFGGAST